MNRRIGFARGIERIALAGVLIVTLWGTNSYAGKNSLEQTRNPSLSEDIDNDGELEGIYVADYLVPNEHFPDAYTTEYRLVTLDKPGQASESMVLISTIDFRPVKMKYEDNDGDKIKDIVAYKHLDQNEMSEHGGKRYLMYYAPGYGKGMFGSLREKIAVDNY